MMHDGRECNNGGSREHDRSLDGGHVLVDAIHQMTDTLRQQ